MATTLYSSIDEKKSYFTCTQIDTEEQLKKVIESLHYDSLVFRGVKDARFKCYTSAQVNTNAECTQSEYEEIIKKSFELVKKSKVSKILLRKSKDVSDFQYLSVLQHFTFGTPLLDFSYRINNALFFALDGMDDNYTTENNRLSNYISLYYFDKKNVNHLSIQDINISHYPKLVETHQFAKEKLGNYYEGVSEQAKNSYKYLYFDELKEVSKGGLSIDSHFGWRIDFEDSLTGIDFTYDISNVRIDSQRGLFVFSSSSNLSWEESAKNWYSRMPATMFCLNIHKSLKNFIQENYLAPLNITNSLVYPNDKESNKIIRLLLKLPIDSRLRPHKKPQNIDFRTWKKYQKLYHKKISKQQK